MRAEPGVSTLANMSAPPRSTVMLPRLVTPVSVESDDVQGRPAGTWPVRDVAFGPGGGRLLSGALCLARVELPTAVCAWLGLGRRAPALAAPQGLARALIAVARHSKPGDQGNEHPWDCRAELQQLASMPEAEVAQVLTATLESHDWPTWVAPSGFAMPFGMDPIVGVERLQPPPTPDPQKIVSNPLLAARLVSRIRGPVFMRDAAPALANLLDLHVGATPSGTWELWLPVRPGTVRPTATSPAIA